MVQTVSKEHGRIETRQIQTLPVQGEALGFPFCEQLVLLRRHRTYLCDGHEEEGYLYLICSRPAQQCLPGALLNLSRGHWIIESSIHYCRDVLYREDASQIQEASTARILATMHSLAIYMLRQNGSDRRNTRPRLQKRINRKPGLAVRMIA